MAQKQYSRSIARLVLVAGMCFTAIGLCSVSASAIDNTELLQPVAIKEDSLQPIGQSVLLADVTEENWYEGTSGSLYYCYADGTYATGITTLPNEETYLFALDGTLKTGWQTIDGVRYYFDLTTGQKQFGWISHSNRLYYVFPETGKQVGEGVFNGDIGTIRKISGTKVVIEFDGRYMDCPQVLLDDLELSYAITIHKSMGSEYDTVIIPLLAAHNVLLTRNLLYTAITRAKRRVLLVGEKRALYMAIHRSRPGKRNTMLGELIALYYKAVTHKALRNEDGEEWKRAS